MKKLAVLSIIACLAAFASPAGAATKSVALGIRTTGHTLTVTVAGVKHVCTATVVEMPSSAWEYGQATCGNGTSYRYTPTTLTASVGHTHIYKCIAPRTRIPNVLWTCQAKVVR